MQSTSHDVAIVQLILLAHAESPQITWHGKFAGQTTSFGQLSNAEQSIVHTPAMHVPFEQPWLQTSKASGDGGGGASPVTALASMITGSPASVQRSTLGPAHRPSRQT